MEQYDASTKLWDETFATCKLEDLTGETLEVEPTFDACLNIFAHKTTHVLDFGCGTGDILFQCADFRCLTYGMGIDRSTCGIEYANQMANINHYRNLDFVVGDITYVSQIEDSSFDGIILSNVLDVIPSDVADTILKELTRLLSKNGSMLVKINPYYSDNELQEFGYVNFKDNLYEEDDILRLRNLDTSSWRTLFDHQYALERYLEFPYPWQDGMNRLFLLRKR